MWREISSIIEQLVVIAIVCAVTFGAVQLITHVTACREHSTATIPNRIKACAASCPVGMREYHEQTDDCECK